MAARTEAHADSKPATAPANGVTAEKKPRAPRTEPRKVSVLLRVTAEGDMPAELPPGLKIQLVTVSSDKRRLFDAIQADRTLIALEYTYPATA